MKTTAKDFLMHVYSGLNMQVWPGRGVEWIGTMKQWNDYAVIKLLDPVKRTCKACRGGGFVYVPNGPDDYDKEECQHE
jgi:hypothetical protein